MYSSMFMLNAHANFEDTQVVEVVLGPLDAPMSVVKTSAAIEAFNEKKVVKGA
jgi:hypothetical protein